MNVDEALLKRLEKLSQIEIKDEKRQETIDQLQNILSFVENLSEIDTEDEQTKFMMHETATQVREDVPRDTSSVADEILSHAPKSEDHLFIVPKIIE